MFAKLKAIIGEEAGLDEAAFVGLSHDTDYSFGKVDTLARMFHQCNEMRGISGL